MNVFVVPLSGELVLLGLRGGGTTLEPRQILK